jgi:N-acetylated-alpha-linked acidic dipeptidase
MRLADAEIIPLDYAPQADAIAKYEAELEKLLKDKQEEYTERNLEIEEGVYKALLDPRRPVGPPPVKAVPPYMNFAPMKNAIAALKKSADHYSSALAHLAAHDAQALPPAARERVNAALLRVSRLFLNEQGLPERSWFKNQIYAPGAYTGYDARPIAAVREYMDEEKWREADAQVPMVAEVIVRVASGIEAAARELDRTLSGGS